MKKTTLAVAACLGAALTLSGCDKIKGMMGGKPQGQVAATVNGKEITTLEVRNELGGFGSRDPQVMKAAQQQALQRIILRRILADEARKEKLDKTPEYTMQVSRGEEALLAQLYERKLASALAKPTRQEAEAFVAAHPEMFANRKVLFVDQVIAAPNKIAPDRLQPLKTLDQVRSLLDSEGVQYQQNAVVLDTLSADPRLVTGISNLPPGEIFVIPQNGSMLFNQITGSRSTPFTGDMAVTYAMNGLMRKKAQDTAIKKIEALRKDAEKSIVYNAAFKPPPPKAAAKAGVAPAAAPATGAAPATTASPPAEAPATK